jgi:hypothetical protein
MILVPYFIERTENWIRVNIFLSSGGKQAWHIEPQKDKAILNMLKENGFPVKTLEKADIACYAQVDRTKLDLSPFYTWDEVEPDTSDEDVWRTLTIPVSLWTCSVFRENFLKAANLPLGVDPILNKV